MKIYTRTGDDGTTGLFGGSRVAKSHPLIAAYGTVDETNAFVGVARSQLAGHPGADALDPLLAQIQNDLFVLGADLATPYDAKPSVPRVTAAHATHLEQQIDRFSQDLPALKHFILPGGHAVAAGLHVVRTVARRAERLTVIAAGEAPINEHTVIYLNRLSDLAFVLARWVNTRAGLADTAWHP